MSNTVQTSSLEGYLTSGDSIRVQPNSWFTKYYTCTQEKSTKPEEPNKHTWECMRGHLESYTGTEPTKDLYLEHKIVPLSLFHFDKKAALTKVLGTTPRLPFEGKQQEKQQEK